MSLIDGMLGDCGSEVVRLSKELESSQEALKRIEAVLQTIENAHAAQTSQLEVRIGDLERDLGKTASSFLKVKKEKKHKSSKVRRLQKKIQSHEEMGARKSAETVDPRDDFFVRLTKMAILFESLIAVRRVGGFQRRLRLDSRWSEIREAATKGGSGGATKGGDGETVPTLGEFEDEGDAPRSV
ncbi:Uncharacterized protein Rs2_35555 [Raphanus sativus]|nr:Uncharacterized protein Rs2_35555 [Raphanus sativus]